RPRSIRASRQDRYRGAARSWGSPLCAPIAPNGPPVKPLAPHSATILALSVRGPPDKLRHGAAEGAPLACLRGIPMLKKLALAALLTSASLTAVPALAAGSPVVGTWNTVADAQGQKFEST